MGKIWTPIQEGRFYLRNRNGRTYEEFGRAIGMDAKRIMQREKLAVKELEAKKKPAESSR